MTEVERPPSSLRGEDGYDDDEFEKELQAYIKKEENNQQQKQDEEKMEKGQAESNEPMKKENRQVLTLHSDNEDSELDDYNLTEDQKRALEELDNLKTEMGCYPDEDPPEYNVKERLKVLNEDLKNDPTPVEKQKDSKVVFKPNLVDLVAPPPDFSDNEEEGKSKDKNNKSVKQSKDKPNKDDADKVDSKSEPVTGKKSNSGNSKTKDKVLIEIDGQFQLVDSDDVRARDLGLVVVDSDKDKENESRKSNLQPTPPGRPRPATATNGNRRNMRTTNPRPQSAQVSKGGALDNFSYNSPYALSPREKELMEERKKAMEKHRQDEERRRRNDDEMKERENRDCFESWLKKKRETDRRKRIEEEENRQKGDRADRKRIREFEKNKGFQTYDMLYYKGDKKVDEEDEENEAAFKCWLKEKHNQGRKEKLLKKRQDQEMHDGYYVRSREECDKAYKQWLKQKAIEARKARSAERQKAKLHRLSARRSRKSITLGKSIKDSSSFRYVDYYGYRF